eukprot:5755868-Karenia_brevis.AAC.1
MQSMPSNKERGLHLTSKMRVGTHTIIQMHQHQSRLWATQERGMGSGVVIGPHGQHLQGQSQRGDPLGVGVG